MRVGCQGTCLPIMSVPRAQHPRTQFDNATLNVIRRHTLNVIEGAVPERVRGSVSPVEVIFDREHQSATPCCSLVEIAQTSQAYVAAAVGHAAIPGRRAAVCRLNTRRFTER